MGGASTAIATLTSSLRMEREREKETLNILYNNIEANCMNTPCVCVLFCIWRNSEWKMLLKLVCGGSFRVIWKGIKSLRICVRYNESSL